MDLFLPLCMLLYFAWFGETWVRISWKVFSKDICPLYKLWFVKLSGCAPMLSSIHWKTDMAIYLPGTSMIFILGTSFIYAQSHVFYINFSISNYLYKFEHFSLGIELSFFLKTVDLILLIVVCHMILYLFSSSSCWLNY